MSQEQKSAQEQIQDLAMVVADTQSHVAALEKELAASKEKLSNALYAYQLTIAQVSAINQYAKAESERDPKGPATES